MENLELTERGKHNLERLIELYNNDDDADYRSWLADQRLARLDNI